MLDAPPPVCASARVGQLKCYQAGLLLQMVDTGQERMLYGFTVILLKVHVMSVSKMPGQLQMPTIMSDS